MGNVQPVCELHSNVILNAAGAGIILLGHFKPFAAYSTHI